jgi:small-conductance mechanosensitive channel
MRRKSMEYIAQHWRDLVTSSAVMIGGMGAGFIAAFIVQTVLRLVDKKSEGVFFESLRKHERGPVWLLLPLMGLSISLFFTKLPDPAVEAVRQVIGTLLIAGVAWAVIAVAPIIEDVVLSHFSIDVEDNLQARKVYTQLKFFKRVVQIGVGVIAFALILMQFTKVRQLGTTLLASAGVIGIILGFAAQKTLSTFIAGLQIAIAQPIRIDDVLIVENEWGRVEEITLTYVVLRIWDLRRLILPISYFIEKPFQNWTRTSADLLGTVFLYADYTLPVAAVREELHRLLEQSPFWDGKVWNLQVTNLNEKTVELRALMSASNASGAWNLRCEIREKLLEFVQKSFPQCLPRVRAQVDEGPPPTR